MACLCRATGETSSRRATGGAALLRRPPRPLLRRRAAIGRGRSRPTWSPRTATSWSSKTRASPRGRVRGAARSRRSRRACSSPRSIARRARWRHAPVVAAGFVAQQPARRRYRNTAHAAHGSKSAWPTVCTTARHATCAAIAMPWPPCSPRSSCSAHPVSRARRRSTTPLRPMRCPRSSGRFRLPTRGGKTPCPSQPTSLPMRDPSSRGGRPHPTLSWWLGEPLARRRAQPWMRLASTRPRQTEHGREPTWPTSTISYRVCGTHLS